METSLRPSPHQQGGTKRALGEPSISGAVTVAGQSLLGWGQHRQTHIHVPCGAQGTLSSLGPPGLAGGAVSGTKWVQSPGGPSGDAERQAGRSAAEHRHLVAASETTKPGGVFVPVLGFSVEGFLPCLFPAGLRDYQNPLPSNRILLRCGWLSESPTQALQTRQENKSPKRKSFFSTSPFSPSRHPLPKGVTPPPPTDVTGTPGLSPFEGKKSEISGQRGTNQA